MDIYCADGDKAMEAGPELLQGQQERIVILSPGELEAQAERLGIAGLRRLFAAGRTGTWMDGRGDGICLSLDMAEEPAALSVFWRPGQLILAGAEDMPALQRMRELLTGGEGHPAALGALWGLYLALDVAIHRIQSLLERMEGEIAELDSRVMNHDRSVNGQNFIALRRRLLTLKRHGQPLGAICDALNGNEGGLLPAEAARTMAALSRQCQRVNEEILNLEDYVSEVRGAYQSHLDILMNRSMMALTVLAALFLPPSLIAGWYGMNLKMPEFSWRWGYGYVIALSVVSLAVTVGCFKRKGML